MKPEHAINIMSKLLEMAGDKFSNHGCNDLDDDFFKGMSKEDLLELYKKYHEWNGDPEEFNPEQIGYLNDWMLMGYFSDYIKTYALPCETLKETDKKIDNYAIVNFCSACTDCDFNYRKQGCQGCSYKGI